MSLIVEPIVLDYAEATLSPVGLVDPRQTIGAGIEPDITRKSQFYKGLMRTGAALF